MLPVEQVSEGQLWASQVLIEPNREVVQADHGGEAVLKATQRMGSLMVQPEMPETP